MLSIGFIFPSCEYLYDPFKGDPHTHFQILTVLESHFGNRVNLSLIDLRGIKKEFAIRHIPECDVYLHSVYTLDYNEQISIVRGLRGYYPKALHIGGGPHATLFRDECLRTFDSLILGDGEESIVQAVKDITSGGLKKTYRQKSALDINVYPYPSRKYLPRSTIARRDMMTLKNTSGLDKLLGTTVIFSRGCPYKCYFCFMPLTKEYGLGVRYRKPEFIKAEIEYLKSEYGIQGINLLDEIGIPLSLYRAIPHLEAIARTGIVWRGQCRVDGVTPQIAKLAKESGCVALGMGVESVCQRSLDIINKKIDIKRARESIRLLKQNGIEVRIYIIIGLPGEPENVVQETWTFIQETNPELVYLSLFTVRPGTEVYNCPEKFGIKRVYADWESTMHMFGRYEDETPTLTFEYDEQTPWGKGASKEKIVNDYLELQSRLKQYGLASPPVVGTTGETTNGPAQ